MKSSNHVALYLIWNFVFSHALSSTRFLANMYGFDNNGAPRGNIAKGEEMVKAGKLSQTALDRIKRVEASHENAMANYPIFATAMLLGVVARLPMSTINNLGLTYTLARLAYYLAYVYDIDMLRTVLFWVGNASSFHIIRLAGQKLI